MSSEEKIGTMEIVKVSRHGSGYYLRLSKWIVEAFGIQKGSLLRIKIESLVREGQMGNVTPSDKSRVSKKPEEGARRCMLSCGR